MSSINVLVRGEIFKEPTSGWTCLAWPGSQSILSTGKAIKVVCNIDGLDYPVTLMPTGLGHHMIPLNQAVRKKLKKDVGDTIEILVVSLQTKA